MCVVLRSTGGSQLPESLIFIYQHVQGQILSTVCKNPSFSTSGPQIFQYKQF